MWTITLLLPKMAVESFRVGSPNSPLTAPSSNQPPRPSTRRTWMQSMLGGVGMIGAVAAINNKSAIYRDADSVIAEAVEWIQKNCARQFLHSVVASEYRFLYRGTSENNIRTEIPTPDLLDVDTYGDQEAVRYFERLETLLQSEAVKPSNGHLCTTSCADAAQWGTTTASVWPAKYSHFAWLVDGGNFFPSEKKQRLKRASVVVDGRDCGVESLEDVLQKDHSEVLVATTQWLMVPSALDAQLRQTLQSSFLI